MFPSKKQEPRKNKKKQNKQDQISDATYISDVVFDQNSAINYQRLHT